jgi:hypothetical protein
MGSTPKRLMGIEQIEAEEVESGFPLEWHLRGDLSFDQHHGFEALSFGMSQSPESDPDVECLWKSVDSLGGKGPIFCG